MTYVKNVRFFHYAMEDVATFDIETYSTMVNLTYAHLIKI